MGTYFHDTIQELRYGSLADELTDQLMEVVAASLSTGKPGVLTLTLKVKPGTGGQVEIFDEVKTKVPEMDHGTSIMWATPQGKLLRSDPRQLTIEGLKDIGKPERKPLKEAQ